MEHWAVNGIIKLDNVLAKLFRRPVRAQVTFIKGASDSGRLVVYFSGTGTHAVGMFRRIAPTVLPHGDAMVVANPRNGFDVDAILAAAHRAAVKYKPQAVTVIGVSLGSLTGTRFMARYGEELNIDQFISINGVTSREDILIDERKYFPYLDRIEGGPVAHLVWWFYRWKSARRQPILPQHEYDPKVRRSDIIWQRLHNRYFPYQGYVSAILSIPDRPEQPVLNPKIQAYVISGRNDWLVSPEAGKHIAAQFKRSKVVSNDLRHATLIEYPTAWQREVDRAFAWFASQESRES